MALPGGLRAVEGADATDPEARLQAQEEQLAELRQQMDALRVSLDRPTDGGTSVISAALHGLSFNGSVSQGFAWCDASHKYLTLDTDRGTFAWTDMTLTVTKRLTPQLTAGIQIYNRIFGDIGEHQFELDYAFFDYRWREYLGFKAGRAKTRYGLYNDTQDQDAPHPWALAPYAVYDPSNRGLQLNHDGFDVYGSLDLATIGTLKYAAFGGGAQLLTTEKISKNLTNQGLEIIDSDIHYIAGGDLQFVAGGGCSGLRFGASYMLTEFTQRMRGFQQVPLFALVPVVPVLVTPYELINETNEPLKLTCLYAEYEYNDLKLAAEWEYTDAHVTITFAYPGLPPIVQQDELKSVGWYALAAYRWSALDLDWLETSAYYSSFVNDKNRGFTHGDNYQRDLAFTVRVDVNPNWYWKIEAHDLHGWQAMAAEYGTPAMVPTGHTSEHWFLLAVKTGLVF